MSYTFKHFLRRHRLFVAYCFWGILASALNYLTYKFFLAFLPFNYLIINALTWLVTTIFGYWTNQAFVFKKKNETFKIFIKQAGSFISFRAFSGLADSLSMIVTTSILGWTALPSKLIANMVSGLINYLTSKHVVFKATPIVAETVAQRPKTFSLAKINSRFARLFIWHFFLSNWRQRRYLRKSVHSHH